MRVTIGELSHAAINVRVNTSRLVLRFHAADSSLCLRTDYVARDVGGQG
jgi:hypothetical protein